MSDSGTMQELFAFNDWARDRILAGARKLSDEALERPVEMGPGSLRATLLHLYGAERIWLERWQGQPSTFPRHDALADMAALVQAHRALAAARDAYLRSLPAGAWQRDVIYQRQGLTHAEPLGLLALHVCNHGIHHRAQALNMLRQVGAELPERGADYIFYKLEERSTPRLTCATLAAYRAYGDWATDQLLELAARLNDVELDQGFAMGPGSVRAALLHIYFAERWWLDVWTRGADVPLPEQDPATPIAALQSRIATTRAERDAYLATLTDDDLATTITVKPRPDVVKTFPRGVTALQVCTHGTHHRAQLANMLRRLNVTVPGLDWVLLIRARADR